MEYERRAGRCAVSGVAFNYYDFRVEGSILAKPGRVALIVSRDAAKMSTLSWKSRMLRHFKI